MLSRNGSLSAAQLDALPYAETAPADPVELPFEVTESHPGEDGYRLWMRYNLINDEAARQAYGSFALLRHLQTRQSSS